MTDQLMARIEQLLSLNESLLEEAHRLLVANGWDSEDYGINAVTNEQHYANFKRAQYRNILDYRTIPVNEDKLNGLLDIRFRRIQRAFENIADEGAFGTVLNIAYLLPESIASDLRRNEIKEAVPMNLPLNSEFERNALLLSLMDSISNSTAIREDERELLTRMVHRLKGEESHLYEGE